MCLTCGCGTPPDDHDNPAHITLQDLQAAADASGITLGQAAANIVMTLATANSTDDLDAQAIKTRTVGVHVLKANDERQYTLGLAYPAMVAPGRGADGFNDFISEDALERAAWDWAAKRRTIGLFHQDGVGEDYATVVESYIYRGPDWTVVSPVDGSTVTIVKGSWLLGCLWNDPGWELVKAGLVQGWSPEGGARRRVPTAERLAQLRR